MDVVFLRNSFSLSLSLSLSLSPSPSLPPSLFSLSSPAAPQAFLAFCTCCYGHCNKVSLSIFLSLCCSISPFHAPLLAMERVRATKRLPLGDLRCLPLSSATSFAHQGRGGAGEERGEQDVCVCACVCVCTCVCVHMMYHTAIVS